MKYQSDNAVLIREAITWAADAIAEGDPIGLLTETQAASIAVDAIKRAAKRFDPTRGDWQAFVFAAVAADIDRAVSANEFRHPSEVIADAVFSAGDE